MSTATNGRAREHRISKLMVKHGWLQVMRAAGSKGPADLAMLHPFLGLAWVQVGTAASKSLGPDARNRLVAIAEQTHALPLLATSGPGIPTRFWVVSRGTQSTWTEFPVAPITSPVHGTGRESLPRAGEATTSTTKDTP